MGPLLVEPFAGLGNRMRVVSSAVVLASTVQRPLEIYWIPRSDLNASFDDLFERTKTFSVFEKLGRLRWTRRTHQTAGIRRLAAAIANRVAGVSCCIGENDFPHIWRGEIDLLALAERERRLYIKTCEELGPTDRGFAVFKPIRPLQRRIDALTSRFTPQTIGVHVRGTDHPIARIESPLEAFISAMDAELERNPLTSFFLCTDEPAIERDFEARYPGHIFTHSPKDLARTTPAAIADAVIDLFSLSRTQKILGSHRSSFSDVAAKMGGIPLEVVRRP
jgi:hypothetical protein